MKTLLLITIIFISCSSPQITSQVTVKSSTSHLTFPLIVKTITLNNTGCGEHTNKYIVTFTDGCSITTEPLYFTDIKYNIGDTLK